MTAISRTAMVIVIGGLAGSAAAQSDCRNIPAPPLHAVHVAQPKQIVLSNGMIIFLSEDHELPVVYGSVVVRGGGTDVPADKSGELTIYKSAWRTGGTESKSGDELDDFIEARAAKVETGAGMRTHFISFDSMKNDFDAIFPIVVDLLRKPAFRQDKIDLAKTYLNTAIARRNDDPGDIAAREAEKLGYGPDSPYARQAEYATAASVTRDDLRAFHNRFAHPNNIAIAIGGDFDAVAVEKKLRAAFQSWPRGPNAAKMKFAAHTAAPRVYFVPKDDVTQSTISIVAPGATSYSSSDFAAVVVLNRIFSGGFSGRMMNDIRTKRGLAYGVGGGVGLTFGDPTFTYAYLGTKSSTTVEGIDAVRAAFAALVNEPFSAAELEQAKETILNQFIFTMDSRRKVLFSRLALELEGYPADFWQKYPDAIRAVTTDDVKRAAKTYVHPDQLVIVVVGRETDFDKPLSTLGPVTTLDVTIPEWSGH